MPRGLMGRNAAASPLSRTATPNMKPSHAPAFQPYTAAPTTMGTSTREMDTAPKRMLPPRSWSTTTMAVKMPTPTSCFVF